MLFPLCSHLARFEAVIDGRPESFLLCSDDGGGDGGSIGDGTGGIGSDSAAAAAAGDTSGDNTGANVGGFTASEAADNAAQDAAQDAEMAAQDNIGQSALAAQADAQAAMNAMAAQYGMATVGPAVGTDPGNLGYGFGQLGGFGFGPSISVNGFGLGNTSGNMSIGPAGEGITGINEGFSIPGANLGVNTDDTGALSQSAINQAAQNDAIAAVTGVAAHGLSFNDPPSVGVQAPPAPDPDTGITDEALAAPPAPPAPPAMTNQEAQAAAAMQGLFGIAIPAPPDTSQNINIASFEGPNATGKAAQGPATGPGHSAIGSDAVTAPDAADSAQAQAAIDAAVAQQAIDAANLNAQLNPPSPTVATVAVAPENQPTAQIPGSFPAVPASLTAPPAEAPSLGEQGKAALAAAMNNALGQFGPPAPPAASPTIGQITGFTAPPGPPSMQGFAPPAIAGNLGLNLPNTPPAASPTIGQITGFTAPPGPPSMQGFAPPAIAGNLGLNLPNTPPAPPSNTVGIASDAVAAPNQAAIPGQATPPGFTGLGVDTESGKSFSPQDPDNPTIPDPTTLSRPAPIPEEALPFPTPLSPQIAVPLPQARPDNLGQLPQAPPSNMAIPGSYPSLPATLGPPAAHSQITGPTSPAAQAQSAANLAAQAQAAAQAALAATQAAQSGHTFGAPASGVVGPQSSNTQSSPMDAMAMMDTPLTAQTLAEFNQQTAAHPAPIGSNVASFSPGSNLGSFGGGNLTVVQNAQGQQQYAFQPPPVPLTPQQVLAMRAQTAAQNPLGMTPAQMQAWWAANTQAA